MRSYITRYSQRLMPAILPWIVRRLRPVLYSCGSRCKNALPSRQHRGCRKPIFVRPPTGNRWSHARPWEEPEDMTGHACLIISVTVEWMALFVNIAILDFNLSCSPMLTHLFRYFDCFRRIGMRPRDWRIDSSNSTAVTQFTVSAVRLISSLCDVDCLRALWRDTLLKSCNECIQVSKSVSIFFKVKFRAVLGFLCF